MLLLNLLILSNIFGTSISAPGVIVGNDHSDCVCVAYYLCNSTVDGTLYLHGEGVLDARMSQVYTPKKECSLIVETGAPEVCCHIPDVLKHGIKPDNIVSELKIVQVTQEEIDEIFSLKLKPCENCRDEIERTENPCSVKNRNFGDQGSYEFITPENDCPDDIPTVSTNDFNHNKPYEFANPEPWPFQHIIETIVVTTNEGQGHVEEVKGQVEHLPEVTHEEEHHHSEHTHKYERKCGLPVGVGVRVLGGHVADVPWLVHISTKGQYNTNKKTTCGGSLLLENLVLTAAHCLSAAILNREVLVVQTSRKDQESVVHAVTIHPEYNPSNLLYDFALLWLETPIHLGTEFGTGLICLPQPKEKLHSNTCFATGFNDGFPSQVSVSLVPDDRCQDLMRTTRLGSLFHLHYSFLCAGGKKGEDTCKGDGGSPLVCTIGDHDDSILTQMGLVAWGIGCGTEIPGVYANTKVAIAWIDEEVIARGLDPTYYHVPPYHH